MSETQSGGIRTADAALGASTAIEGVFGFFTSLAQSRALKADARATELAGIAESNARAAAGREAEASGAAIAGASGFTTEYSAADVLSRLAAEAETSAARARWEASVEADRLRYEAKVRKRAGIFGIVTGLVKGAAQAAAGVG